jgi:hypothetical protein
VSEAEWAKEKPAASITAAGDSQRRQQARKTLKITRESNLKKSDV